MLYSIYTYLLSLRLPSVKSEPFPCKRLSLIYGYAGVKPIMNGEHCQLFFKYEVFTKPLACGRLKE